MRVNVYSQEILPDVEPVAQVSKNGRSYAAVRFFLHSSDRLHQTPEDDDRSCVTFWLPSSQARRQSIAILFEQAASLIRGFGDDSEL